MGVDTVKRDNTKAKDGFDALADLDSNQDGVMNAQDTAFASLRIWRDLNQDGISQPGELQTLAQAGIVSINVSGKAAQVDLLNLVVLGKGNVQTVKGSFTRSDSSTGGAGETSSAAANLDLLVNTFYRTFTTTVPLTEAAKTLPDFLPPPLGIRSGWGHRAAPPSPYACAPQRMQESKPAPGKGRWTCSTAWCSAGPTHQR